MDIVRVHADCHGIVQGVGFRSFTETFAKLLGLNGTVENKPDDHVEVFVEGDRKLVEVLTKAITFGPRSARVDDLILNEIPVTGEIGFEVIYPPIPKFEGRVMTGNPFMDWLASQKFTCDVCEGDFYMKPVVIADEGGVIWQLCPTCAINSI